MTSDNHVTGPVTDAMLAEQIAAMKPPPDPHTDAWTLGFCRARKMAADIARSGWTDEELTAIRQLGAELELSDKAVLRCALRHYQADHERLKAGETVSWSGDAQRAEDFFPGHLAMKSKEQAIAEALLPTNLWAVFGRELVDAMPAEYREEIGRKAIEGACYIDQLETINASRHARGAKPLTMGQFMAGSEDEQ